MGNAKLKRLLADSMLEAWRDDYNHHSAHGELAWLKPAAYAERWTENEELDERPWGMTTGFQSPLDKARGVLTFAAFDDDACRQGEEDLKSTCGVIL